MLEAHPGAGLYRDVPKSRNIPAAYMYAGPMKRPGQPAELAPAYVVLASDEASYISGATIAVTGGKPLI